MIHAAMHVALLGLGDGPLVPRPGFGHDAQRVLVTSSNGLIADQCVADHGADVYCITDANLRRWVSHERPPVVNMQWPAMRTLPGGPHALLRKAVAFR